MHAFYENARRRSVSVRLTTVRREEAQPVVSLWTARLQCGYLWVPLGVLNGVRVQSYTIGDVWLPPGSSIARVQSSISFRTNVWRALRGWLRVPVQLARSSCATQFSGARLTFGFPYAFWMASMVVSAMLKRALATTCHSLPFWTSGLSWLLSYFICFACFFQKGPLPMWADQQAPIP